MFKKPTNTEDGDRGQVGIGTLIVFIALVLVAAIAAGVLINTAGFLQSQAEQTGQESTDQVANNLQVASAFGTASTGDPGTVSTPNIVVQLAPGSDSINLGNVEVQIFLEDASTVTGEIDGGSFGDEILDSGESQTIDLEDDSDISAGDLDLDAGETAEVVLITDDGSSTEVLLKAPDPIVTDGDVRLDS